ncbi:hypothetical protein FA95DRAFT_1572914 [Auriscalpium vulgare]|uniref:Uncharacterized protein n=1 Tax=Auriscalpium vulgare TaxID=40419 RepID=A0ACB8RTC1_9AGAM|nr:hypothetical protein FA95DRAFT_1572914 [Auriscalpium vulgare]
MPVIPLELQRIIIKLASSCQPDRPTAIPLHSVQYSVIPAFCLVNSAWLSIAQPVLFHTLPDHFAGPWPMKEGCVRLKQLMDALSSNPHLGTYVRRAVVLDADRWDPSPLLRMCPISKSAEVARRRLCLPDRDTPQMASRGARMGHTGLGLDPGWY